MNVLRELRKFKTKSALAKIRILILLAVMLTVSTYAWFSSEKDVSVGNIRGIVTEWDVEYSIDDVAITTEEIEIACDEFYPGMPHFEKTIATTNKTELGAELKYEIISVRIFGEEKLPELISEGAVEIDEENKEIKVFTTEKYPFTAGLTYDTDKIDGVDPITGNPISTSHAEATVYADWTYERSGATKNLAENDTLDTYYGEEAYEYYQDETLSEQYSPIEITLKITSAREGMLD